MDYGTICNSSMIEKYLWGTILSIGWNKNKSYTAYMSCLCSKKEIHSSILCTWLQNLCITGMGIHIPNIQKLFQKVYILKGNLMSICTQAQNNRNLFCTSSIDYHSIQNSLGTQESKPNTIYYCSRTYLTGIIKCINSHSGHP